MCVNFEKTTHRIPCCAHRIRIVHFTLGLYSEIFSDHLSKSLTGEHEFSHVKCQECVRNSEYHFRLLLVSVVVYNVLDCRFARAASGHILRGTAYFSALEVQLLAGRKK